MARDGRMSDGDSALALLRCEPMLLGKQHGLEVVAYDPTWPLLFEAEAARLAVIFGEQLAAIHHMGSTSVPGIWAKPVIDIMLIVYDIETVDSLNDTMLRAGLRARKASTALPAGAFSTFATASGACSTCMSTKLTIRRSPIIWISSNTCERILTKRRPTARSKRELVLRYLTKSTAIRTARPTSSLQSVTSPNKRKRLR